MTATTETTEPTTIESTNDLIVPLPKGQHACMDCGVAVADDDDHPLIETDTIRPFRGTPDWLPPTTAHGRRGTPVTIVLSRCDECGQREQVIGRIGANNPAASLSAHKLRSALHALVLIGQPVPDDIADDRAARRQLVHSLFTVGVGLTWATRLIPSIDPDADPGTCAATPWAHVPDDRRSTARKAYAGLLASRIAPPAPVSTPTPPPPCDDLRGCLLCGVGELVATTTATTARATATKWRPITIATPSVIGAPAMQGQPVYGYLCPACDDACNSAGAIGATAAARSLRDHLTATGDTDALGRVAGADLPASVAWAGHVLRARRQGRPAPRPNATRWEHLSLV